MLKSLEPNSSELLSILGGVNALQAPPHYIEAAGEKPFGYETFLGFSLLPDLGLVQRPYDGLIEEIAAFEPLNSLPRQRGFNDDHWSIRCDPPVTQWIASQLVYPAATPTPTPTPGPTVTPHATPTPTSNPPTPTPTPTATFVPTSTPNPTPVPTSTPSQVPTSTPIPTPTPLPVPVLTAVVPTVMNADGGQHSLEVFGSVHVVQRFASSCISKAADRTPGIRPASRTR